jgi:RNA polymerase sigma factor (sigma-70 family)
MSSSSDGDIIIRSLDQRAAFAELYDRHQRSVYRYAARRIGQLYAEDVTSETFLVAFSRREVFDGSSSALPWLLGISTTLMRQYARQEARAWKGMLASDLARVSVDEFDVVNGRLDAKAVSRRMGKALARLPAGDRDVLLLHTFGELSYEAIGVALGVPIGTVRSRLNRARRKLRTAIDPATGREKEIDNGRDYSVEPTAG